VGPAPTPPSLPAGSTSSVLHGRVYCYAFLMQFERASCDLCKADQPMVIEFVNETHPTGRYRGADAICAVCGWIFCTFYEAIEQPEVH
jgi:hypothetical protein